MLPWSFNRIINKEIKIMLSNTHSEHKIVTIEMLKRLTATHKELAIEL